MLQTYNKQSTGNGNQTLGIKTENTSLLFRKQLKLNIFLGDSK